MRNERRGVVDAVARTALPLSADETKALQQKVAGMTGRTVDLRVEVDESLIGGLTVRVGDTLYDASVRGRLERLRERLMAGAR
jgi:F-type H+-transporting ATPase subunit delta